MDNQTFQTYINSNLKKVMGEQIAHYESLGGPSDITHYLQHLSAVIEGGKRIRPYLTWSIIKHYAPQERFEDHSLLLVSLELFHVFCLIHDDVMDESDVRHGKKTMQAHAAEELYKDVLEPRRMRVSDSQAILAGDILFNTVFKLFYQYITLTESSKARSISKTFHTLIDEVCLGQMIDVDLTTKEVTTEETIILKNILKTARYSFVQPLSLGALVANRVDLLPFISSFGEKLGLLYQIQDDILDINGDPEKTKKLLFQDVTQKQSTILSHYIKSGNNEFTQQLNSYLGKPVTQNQYAELRDMFENSGALLYAKNMITDIQSQLKDLFKAEGLSESDQAFFQAIIKIIENRSK
jgi:geranylgeranyl diphosphate synthase type I